MISKGNHTKFARFVLLAIREEATTQLPFFLSRGYQPQPLALADNPYMHFDLDYSGYRKNLSQ